MIFSSDEAQTTLANFYRLLMADPAVLISKATKIRKDRKEVELIEDAWHRHEESAIDLTSVPLKAKDFLQWYLQMEKKMNNDIAHFINFLKYSATRKQIAYYICMEELIDGSFDDLMALVQVGMPTNPKMCAANNYWDEMGNGNFNFVHTTMFKTSSTFMKNLLRAENIDSNFAIPSPCLMNGNILLMWALRREYNMRLVGGMGLVEGSAPLRFAATTFSLKRNNFPEEVIAYHRAHIGIDTNHSREWYDHVLYHYAHISKDVTRELAIGVLIRYRIALNYYNFLMQSLTSLHPCNQAS